MEQQTLVSRQFGAVAQAYLGSAVHAQGADLLRLTELARTHAGLEVLDLGCGAGHAGFALAEGGARVTAYDLSPEMLSVVRDEAARRGLASLQTRQGPAERLPFPDASFDLVVTRLSAHHWSDVPSALLEANRVLKAGGSLIVIDVIAPESPLLDTILQTVEILRDPSHVRDYRLSEWSTMFRDASLQTPVSDTWTLQVGFDDWTQRMQTAALRVQAIRDVFDHAPTEARQHFRVQPDYSFRIDVAWMRTRRRDEI